MLYKRTVEAALRSVQFLQPARARENLARLERELPPAAQQALPRLLPSVPDPDTALSNLERFAASATPEVREYLGLHPPALHHLLTLFAYSQFLANTLIRQPDLALWLEREPTLYRVKTGEEMSHSLSAFAERTAAIRRRTCNTVGPVQAARVPAHRLARRPTSGDAAGDHAGAVRASRRDPRILAATRPGGIGGTLRQAAA